MQVTYIELSDYFQRCIPKAKGEGYILVIALIARYSDAQELYEKLEKSWASLNDLTGNRILFVFSTPKVRKKASFLHIPGRKIYEGEMCPFVELLNGNKVEDNNGPFEYFCDNYDTIDWKQKHSQTITKFAADYNIAEEKIPCLFLYNLINDTHKIVPVGQTTDIYAMIKAMVAEIAECGRKSKNIEEQLEEYRNIEAYYWLYEKLENAARRGKSKQCEAIRKILQEEKTYKEVKNDIFEPTIKRDLKRIGQWKKQYFNAFEKDDTSKNRYLELKKEEQDIANELNVILANLGNVIEEKGLEKRKNRAAAILHDLLSACVKLQSNATYYTALEDQRNDYIRDLLKMAKYDVVDQTRKGTSSAGKRAGEIDILIEEDELPVTVIEALNLDSLKTQYLDEHLDRIYKYDTAGNEFNIILLYVSAANFGAFCEKYFNHIKEYPHTYPLISAGDKVEVDDFPYSNIRVMKTLHNRNDHTTILYHVCVSIKK